MLIQGMGIKMICRSAVMLLLGCSIVAQAEQSAVESKLDTIDAIKQSHAAGGCFYIHSVDSYRVVDSRHVLVYAPSRNKPWLLEFSNTCPLLRNGDAIMLEGSNGQVCGNAGDALKTRNQNCGIVKTFSVSGEDADAIKALSK